MKKAFFMLAMTLSSTVSFASSELSSKMIQDTIAAINTDLSCRTSDDCGSIAIGHRACGGPSEYILVSALNPHFETIKILAQKTEELEAAAAAEGGPRFSICSIELPLNASCKKNVCVAE